MFLDFTCAKIAPYRRKKIIQLVTPEAIPMKIGHTKLKTKALGNAFYSLTKAALIGYVCDYNMLPKPVTPFHNSHV